MFETAEKWSQKLISKTRLILFLQKLWNVGVFQTHVSCRGGSASISHTSFISTSSRNFYVLTLITEILSISYSSCSKFYLALKPINCWINKQWHRQVLACRPRANPLHDCAYRRNATVTHCMRSALYHDLSNEQNHVTRKRKVRFVQGFCQLNVRYMIALVY